MDNTIVKIMTLMVLLLMSRRLLAAPAAPEAELRIGNGSEPRELDPGKAVGTSEHHIITNLFEGLTTQDGLQDQPVPGVATDWTESADHLVYTFHLRADAKWSDGAPVIADDFVYAWRRMLTASFAAEYAYELFYINNAQAFYEGKLKNFDDVGVTAVNDRILRVQLARPTPFFLGLVSESMLAPVPKHVLTKLAPDADWTKAGVMVSNGPFQLKDWRLNQEIRIVRNPQYWDRARVLLDSAVYLPIESLDTSEKAFFSGDLDLTDDAPSIKYPVYRARHARHPDAYDPFKPSPMLSTYFYLFNTTKKPFNDRRVRQALAMTIDRTLLTERITGAGEVPLTAFSPAGVRSYQPKTALEPKLSPELVAKARALLKDAGYANPADLPPIDLHYNTSDNHKRIALALQQMWRKALGIRVELYNEEWKVFQNSEQTLNFSLARYGWTGDYLDPNTFLELLVTGNGNNNTGWSNKTFDALMLRAGRTGDAAVRQDLLRQAEELALAELPVIPLFVSSSRHLVAERVKLRDANGRLVPWHSTQLDGLELKNCALDAAATAKGW